MQATGLHRAVSTNENENEGRNTVRGQAAGQASERKVPSVSHLSLRTPQPQRKKRLHNGDLCRVERNLLTKCLRKAWNKYLEELRI